MIKYFKDDHRETREKYEKFKVLSTTLRMVDNFANNAKLRLLKQYLLLVLD